MTGYQRIFGAGPRGLFISCLTITIIYLFNQNTGIGRIFENDALRIALFAFSIIVTLVIAAWSVKSLPPKFRGEFLVITGAFAYFRHPLYGAFLSFFNFGLAIYLNDFIYIIWAFLQHPVWHFNIKYEEKLMIDKFGEEYLKYSEAVSRFIPAKALIRKFKIL